MSLEGQQLTITPFYGNIEYPAVAVTVGDGIEYTDANTGAKIDFSGDALRFWNVSQSWPAGSYYVISFTDSSLPTIQSLTLTSNDGEWPLDDISFGTRSITIDASNLGSQQFTGWSFSAVLAYTASDITLSADTVNENSAGATIGTLSNNDIDGSQVTYSVADNDYFTIDGTTLKLKDGVSLDYEAAHTRSVEVTVNDSDGGSFTKLLTVNVTDVSDAPTAQDAIVDIYEDHSYTFKLSTFGFADEDGDSLSYVTITGWNQGNDGVLTLNGNPVAVGDQIVAADIPKLVYTPPANHNSPQGPLAVFYYTVTDTGSSVTGQNTSVEHSIEINVYPVDDAPTAQDNTITLSEDGSYTFSESDFGFADVDGHSLSAVRIQGLSGSGTLIIGEGAPFPPIELSAGDEIGVDLIPYLTWIPTANASGNGLGSFTFTVIDSNWFDFRVESIQHTITFDVTAVNDAPSASDNTITVNEDASHTFAADDFGFADPDGNALDHVTILGFSNLGTLLLDGDVVHAGDQIAAADLSKLVWTPPADLNGDSLGYVQFKLTDNGGTDNGGKDTSAIKFITFNVAGVNDAPTASDNTVSLNEDGAYTFSSTDFGFSDSDGNSFDHITITSLPQFGHLKLNGVAVHPNDVIAVADLPKLVWTPEANTSGDAQSSFTFTVSDNGGTDNGGSNTSEEKKITFDVAAVNDAPTASDNTITILEDGNYTFSATDFGFSDSDNNSFDHITIKSLPLLGQLTLNGQRVLPDTQIAVSDLPKLVWTLDFPPNQNGNGIGSFTFTVSDNGGTANGGADTSATKTITANVTPVNDAPVADEGGVFVLEDQSHTFAAADFRFSDRDGNTFDHITITELPAAGTLLLNGAAVNKNDQIAVANLSKLVWTPPAGTSGFDLATLKFTVSDNGGTANGGSDTSAEATLHLNVGAVNDAPTAQAKTITLAEDASYTFSSTDFGFADSDGNSFDHITIASMPLSGSLKLNGNTVHANDQISVANLSKLVWTPAANANGNGLASFTFTVSDNGGTDNGGADTSTAKTITFNVTAINDAPTAQAKTITLAEDASYTFSSTDFGFADSDGNSFDHITIASMPLSGSLKLNGNTVHASDQISVANLSKLVWTPAANANGNGLASFTFTVSDNGGTGNGGADTSAAKTITFNVTAVNDAPTDIVLTPKLSLPGKPIAVIENAKSVTIGTLASVDPDAGDTRFTYTVDDSRFTLSGSKLMLKAGQFLDYEKEKTVSLTVTSRDAGGLSFAETFKINVVDRVDVTRLPNGNTTAIGTAGIDTIKLVGADDIIRGLGGNDTIGSTKGNDRLSGGTGADTFIFTTKSFRDTITDFNVSQDTIDLRNWKAIDSLADIHTHATDHKTEVWIEAGSDVLVIKNLHEADLDKVNFQFAL